MNVNLSKQNQSIIWSYANYSDCMIYNSDNGRFSIKYVYNKKVYLIDNWNHTCVEVNGSIIVAKREALEIIRKDYINKYCE